MDPAALTHALKSEAERLGFDLTGTCPAMAPPGIYLTRDMDKEKYEALFRRFLEGGFLIPPSKAEPLILPFTMSDGEEAKLAQLLVN